MVLVSDESVEGLSGRLREGALESTKYVKGSGIGVAERKEVVVRGVPGEP